jgi:hypothetical protein
MSEPPITTVIPTYRRPATLRRAIASVLNQTFPDFRVCVYDDASSDETAAVVKEFSRADSRVEYLCRPNNIGLFANFVDGANRVKTPYFSLLPDDDVMLPHFFETALEGFRQHPEAALSILTSIRMSASGFALDAPILQWPQGLLEPPMGMLSILRYGNPDLPGLLVSREVWRELGGFDEKIGPCFDMDFELRASARYPVVVSKHAGGILLVHDGSNEARSYLEWVWPAIPRMAEKLVRDVNIPLEARQEVAETFSHLLRRGLIMRGVVRSIIGGKWDEAQMAANLFLEECKWTRAAGVIRPALLVGKTVPGTRALLRAFLAARASLRVLQHFDLQWRFRAYSKLVRASP